MIRVNKKNRFSPIFFIYYSANKYELEYYFDEKDETTENKIEQLLNKNEIVWEKSDDIYIRSENMFVIYYYIF